MDQILINPSDERRIVDFRPLGIADVVVLGRYSYTKAHAALADHDHGDRLEICYLEKGEQVYVVDGESFRLTGGDVFITLPHERHSTGDTLEGKGVLFWSIVRIPNGGKPFLGLPPDEGATLVDRLLHPPCRVFHGNESIRRTLYQILATSDAAEDSLRVANLRNLLLRFLLDVATASDETEPAISPCILAIQHFVAEHIDQPMSVRMLARKAGLSESRFKTRFKQEVGVPPADYVARVRIERAKTLLAESDWPVTRISLQLGFSTTQYFATTFRRYTGQSPSDFRKASMS